MVTTISKRRSASSFLKEGFLLPYRNVRLFILPMLLTVAYTAARVVGYSAAVQPLLDEVVNGAKMLQSVNRLNPGYAELARETRARTYRLVATSAAYLFATAFAVGPAVTAVTVSASVAVCRAPARRAEASFKGMVFSTAVFCSVLHVACQSAIQALGMCIVFYLKVRSLALLSMEVLLFFFLSHGFKHCLQLVGTIAVVMSAAETKGCYRGVGAFRKAWWLVAGDTATTVILVVLKGAAAAGLWLLITVLPEVYFFRGMTGALFKDVMYAVMSGAVYLWFVCATTVYYFRRSRHRNGGDGII